MTMVRESVGFEDPKFPLEYSGQIWMFHSRLDCPIQTKVKIYLATSFRGSSDEDFHLVAS
jgi:hypothetical protein